MSTQKKAQLTGHQLAAVARLFSVLSESSRLVLLQALHAGPLTVNDWWKPAG